MAIGSNMFFSLVIWTVVAASGSQYGTQTKAYGWRELIQTKDEQLCHEAARKLGYTDQKEYRCLQIR